MLIYNRRNTPCDRLELVFDVYYTALLSNRSYAAAILHALGYPLISL